jgi:hypothetical protein
MIYLANPSAQFPSTLPMLSLWPLTEHLRMGSGGAQNLIVPSAATAARESLGNRCAGIGAMT